jgi:antitoxin ParD1/3/4
MGRNTSVSLGDHFEKFVDTRVSAGRFKNASEVIRAGLRLLEEEESKVVALKQAIKEGEESGFVTDFDAKKHLKRLKFAKKKNAQI